MTLTERRQAIKSGRGAPKEIPAPLGFRRPAEWEPHEATWIGWPHNRTDWPGKMGPIPWVYGEIVKKLAEGEIVRILVESEAHGAAARRVLNQIGVGSSKIQFFRLPTNRGWTRDFGPIFIRRDEPRVEVAIARFRFNAWAKYKDWKLDDAVPVKLARRLGLRLFNPGACGRDVVLEGGSIDVNGRGTLLTTEECLLDQDTQTRNPGLERNEVESVMRDYLGTANVLWLGKGIAGDDTHGHVDDICRFTGPGTVVLCREQNPGDENYKPLEENRERLEGMRLEDGSKLEVVPIPMPSPLQHQGRRLPASYANFYVSNSAVLVPTFNDPNDRIALGILAALITDRPVIGIHAVDLVWGLGTLHCLTQEQPTAD
ncbi:MAG TPA: agmatine deiminase family protein [Blastocatellia bacterium]|nr:agmatine deiminase family protein [Blastocatellia bacterium]